MNLHEFVMIGQNSLYSVIQSLRAGITCQENELINCLSGGFTAMFTKLVEIQTPYKPIFIVLLYI